MLTPDCETERNARVSYSSGAMEECLRRFESPVVSQTAKQGEHKSATKHGNSIGAMEECLRRFKSPAVHVASGVGMDLAVSDRHGSADNMHAATLPNWATSLISILRTSNGAMEECLRRFKTARDARYKQCWSRSGWSR